MSDLRVKKTFKRKNDRQKTHLINISKDLLIEILARVASQSRIDFINAQRTCKDLHDVANDDYVHRHMRLDDLPLVGSWKKDISILQLLDRCFNVENPESLFWKGMIEYFADKDAVSALELLKKATKDKHIGAMYLYGIILLHSGEHGKGLDLLHKLNGKKSRRVAITQCRETIRMVADRMWPPKNMTEAGGDTKICSSCDRNVEAPREGWDSPRDQDFHYDIPCEACFWNIELTMFRNMLREGSFRI